MTNANPFRYCASSLQGCQSKYLDQRWPSQLQVCWSMLTRVRLAALLVFPFLTFGQVSQRDLVFSPVDRWPSGAKRHAIVIGVDSYQDQQVTPLRGAAGDATALAAALEQFSGFARENISILTSQAPADRQPTKSNILRRLSLVRNSMPQDGLLLLAFSGHGIERNGKPYLLPQDAQIHGDLTLLEDTALPVELLRERIRQSGVGQVLILLDACRNDPSTGRSAIPNPLTTGFARALTFNTKNSDIKAFATIYATAVGQRAYEYPEKQQGYFTWSIVEGLKGAAANQHGDVTLSSLVRFVQDSVTVQTGRDLTPERAQKPFAVIEGYKADDLIIASASPQTAALPKPTPTAPTGAAKECSFDETRGLAQAVLLSVGQTCSVILGPDEMFHFKVPFGAEQLLLTLDARRRNGQRGNLKAQVDLLTATGLPTNATLTLNEIAPEFHTGRTIGVNRAGTYVLRLRNDYDRAQFWLTVSRKRDTVGPLFGSLVPQPVDPKKPIITPLKPNATAYSTFALGRGDYQLHWTMASNSKVPSNLGGVLHLIDANGQQIGNLEMSVIATEGRAEAQFSLRGPTTLLLRTYMHEYTGNSTPAESTVIVQPMK